MKVTVLSITEITNYAEDSTERTKVYVDDELIVEGWYGGEPEDNARYRDYGWVEDGFVDLAKALGVEVVVEYEEKEKEI